jgi:RNA 2',3'-cyclic 3'-phosphodiesterase
MESHTHYFYALRLPIEIKEQLHHYTIEVKEKWPFSRWVHQEDYHITLAFLGFAPNEKLEHSKKLVKQYVGQMEPFPLRIETIGLFGQRESPRIFLVGVNQEERLHTVRNQVYRGCQEAGFTLETRAFHPHITLARKWKGDNPFSKTAFEEECTFKPLPFVANEVVLYQTHLKQNPKYEAIEVYSLGNL